MKRLQSETLASASNSQTLNEEEDSDEEIISSTPSPNKKVKTCVRVSSSTPVNAKELIRVSLYTKPENDGKDETDLSNWNRCDSRVLSCNDQDEDEVYETSCEHRIMMVSHVKDFDSHSYSNEDEDADSTIGEIAERVRFGILILNISEFDLAVRVTMDQVELSSWIIGKGKKTNFISYEMSGSKRLPLLLKRHSMAFDESDVDKELIDKLGMIKVEIYRAVILEQYSTDEVSETNFQSNNIKVKSSMVKDSSMSLDLGVAQALKSAKVARCVEVDKLIDFRIKYRNYTGFLLELVRAGLTIQQQTNSETNSSERTIIDISDDESEISPTIQSKIPPQKPSKSNVTKPIIEKFPSNQPIIINKSCVQLMSKIKAKANEIERKSTEELLNYLKQQDDDMYHNIKEIFTSEGIDGVSFLLLNIEAMQVMKLRMGDQVKIKQILQQINENSNL